MGSAALGCTAWTLSGGLGSAWPLIVMAGTVECDSVGDIVTFSLAWEGGWLVLQ